MKAKTTTPPRAPDSASNRPVASPLRIRLGEGLQKNRVRTGLTEAQLALAAKLSLKYVGEIERGEANTTVDVLERLAAAVHWNPVDAFEGLPEPLTEVVRVLLIEKLRENIKSCQEAVQWLEALDPARNRTVVTPSGSDVVAGAVTSAEAPQQNRKRVVRRPSSRRP